MLLRRIWYGRIFRYLSFLLWFSLIGIIYSLLTIKPNFLFFRRTLKSLKLLIVGQRRKFFKRLVRGGGSLNRTWLGNGPLQPTRTVWTTLLWKKSFPSLFWWCQRLKSRIKSQTSFKNQRVAQSRIKIQVKIQEKTQDMQELQEKHQEKYKNIFSKEKIE